MSTVSGTQVYVTVDGIPNHSHPGVKGSHPAWKKHETDLHKAHKADKPTNLADLTPEVQALYAKALKGESLMFMCTAGRKVRRSEGIFLGRRPSAAKPTLQDEAEAFMAQELAGWVQA